MRILAAGALVLTAILLVACPTPSPPSGALICGTGGSCPQGYRCGADKRCVLPSENLVDLSSSVDLFGVDQAVDTKRLDQCERICTCFMPTCKDIVGAAYPDAAACQADCLSSVVADLDCRELHCGFAKAGSPGTHCFHARGLTAPDNSMLCP